MGTCKTLNKETVTVDDLRNDTRCKIDLTTVPNSILCAYVDRTNAGGLPEFGQGQRVKRVKKELKTRGLI